MSALKNETEEDIQLSKNPSRDKVKRGRSNGTKLWEKHIKDTCSNITPTPNSPWRWLISHTSGLRMVTQAAHVLHANTTGLRLGTHLHLGNEVTTLKWHQSRWEEVMVFPRNGGLRVINQSRFTAASGQIVFQAHLEVGITSLLFHQHPVWEVEGHVGRIQQSEVLQGAKRH